MTRETLIPILEFFDPLFLIYFACVNLIYVVIYIFGSFGTYRRIQELQRENYQTILRSNSLPEISFLVPAFNEANNIMLTLKSLLNLSYRYKQIIVINDGSTDETLALLKYKLDLVSIPLYYTQSLPSKPIRGLYQSRIHPEVIVVDKENGEKFDALNAGLNFCKNAYFCNVDSDTYIDDAGFNTLIRPILASSQTVAISATVRIRNGLSVKYHDISTSGFPNTYLPTMQAIEYMRTALMREGCEYLGGNYGFSGAFSCFRKDIIEDAGGFAPTFTNDLEIIMRLQRIIRAKKEALVIDYLPDPISWTKGPKTLKSLGQQRSIWHRGLFESLWFHKSLFFNPKYGAFGLFMYPFLLFCEALEPLVEFAAYMYIIIGLLFGIIAPSFIYLFVAVTIGLVFMTTLFCLLVEELSFRKYTTKSLVLLFFYSILENVGYRQMTVYWRCRGFIQFLRKFNVTKKSTKIVKHMVEKALGKKNG